MELKTVDLVTQDGVVYHREAQDVEPILRHVKYLRDSGQTGDPEMRHAAKIPVSISENWRKARGISFHEMYGRDTHSAAFLNSEEVRRYRIWQGRI